MRVSVVVCDWCLEESPVADPVSVNFGGLALDLCPEHAARWSDLTRGLSGAAAPALAPSTEGQVSGKRRGRAASSTETSAELSQAPEPAGRARRSKASKVAAKASPRARATKLSGRGPAKGKTRSKAASSAAKTSRPAVDSKAVRAWANANGIAAPARGPLSAALVEQFLASPLNAPATVPKAKFQHA